MQPNFVAAAPAQPRSIWTVRNVVLGAAALCAAVGIAHHLQSSPAKPALPKFYAAPRIATPTVFECEASVAEYFINPEAVLAKCEKQRDEMEKALSKAQAAKELNLSPDEFELRSIGTLSLPRARYDEVMALREQYKDDPETLIELLTAMADESSDNSR